MSSDNAEKAAPAADATAAPTSAPETGAGAGAGAGAPVTVDPALAKKIIKQVDFYFSAHNLPSDKFLSEQVSKDAEGFVPLEVMLRFNRLKALSDDEKVVAAALAGSTVVTVSEDGKRIRRTKPLPTDTSATSFDECTIYAKGFPDNAELEDIEDTFAAFGTVGRVTMRRTFGRKGHFKGSVFVTFEEAETVDKVLAGEVKFMGRPLAKVMRKAEYLKAKAAERAAAGGDAGEAGEDSVHKFSGVDRVEKGLLRINVSDMAAISQHDLREEVAKHGDLKFFEADKDGAVARFGTPGDAEKAKNALEEAKTEFGGEVPTYSVMEGDAATLYWNKVDEFHRMRWEDMRRRKNKKANRRGGRGGRGGRGRGRGRGGRGNRNDKRKRSDDGGRQDKSKSARAE